MRTHRSLKPIKNEIRKLIKARNERHAVHVTGVLPRSADPKGQLRRSASPYAVVKEWEHLDDEITKQKEAIKTIKARPFRTKRRHVKQVQKKDEKGKKAAKGGQKAVVTV